MTFTITQNQNQYLTYCLKDEEADAYLEVVPARGGIITKLVFEVVIVGNFYF